MFYLSKFSKKVFFRIQVFIIFFMVKLYAIQDIGAIENIREEESLFLRRVIEFWEEGERYLAKKEMERYLEKEKETPFFDYLYALLGDICLSEDKFKEASLHYSKIKDKEVKKKIFINLVQALYEQKNYPLLCQECANFSDFIHSCDKDLFLRFCFLMGESYYQRALYASDDADKVAFAKIAKEHFSKFIGTSYEPQIIEYLADISAMLQEYKIATDLYLKLAGREKQKKEKFLFKAACLQTKYDKEAALHTFSQICRVGKTKLKEAAMNKLILLMEEKRYSEVLLAKEQLEKLLEEQQKPLFSFFLAKSYFVLEDYKRAAIELKKFFEKPDKDHGIHALDMTIVCAEKLKDAALLDQAIQISEKLFPENPNFVKMCVAKALFHKNQRNYQTAKETFLLIEKRFPEFNDPNFLMEVAHFYYEIGDYLQSRLKFKLFITEHQEHPLIVESWRYFINSSIKMMDKISGDKILAAKNLLKEDLEDFLKNKEIITEKEQCNLGLLLAQLKYELEDYDAALLEMQLLFEHFPTLKKDAQANLLFALICQKKKAMEEFCKFAEEALLLDKKNMDSYNLRVYLFNSYLELSRSQKKFAITYTARAAEHLFQALHWKDAKVLLENMLWLGDHYYSQVQAYMEEDWKHKISDHQDLCSTCDKAIFVLEKICQDQALEDLEEGTLKLADLYGYQGNLKKQMALLESLREKKSTSQKVYFDLGKLYQNLGKKEQAIQMFEELLALQKKSFYHLAAHLYLCRLKLEAIEKEKLHFENMEVVKYLSTLKNLKLQKSLQNEPLHLEAALDYVDMQSCIEKNEKKRLHLLMQVKEDFSSLEDIISQDYQNSKKIYPEKAKILQAYLLLIDTQIHLAQAKIEKDKKHAFLHLSKIKDIHQQMIKNNLLVSHYLEEKLQKVFQETQQILREQYDKK